MSKKTPPNSSQDEIDENLRRVYQQTLEEEVPERFRELLAKLKSGPGVSEIDKS